MMADETLVKSCFAKELSLLKSKRGTNL